MKRTPFPSRLLFFPALAFLFLFVGISPCEALSEETARIHFLHALKSKQEGDLLSAERLLKKAIDLEPDNPDYHFELASLYIERGNLVGGRLELEQAVMIAPAHLAAHYNLGLVYREFGRMSEARDEFQKVLEIDPNHVKAQLQIGYTYQEEGFVEEAREAFQIARQMDITDQEPQRALEDLAQYEIRARERSRMETAQAFERNRERLFTEDPFTQREGVQPAGKQALAQAAALLVQQLLTSRSRAASDQQGSSGDIGD